MVGVFFYFRYTSLRSDIERLSNDPTVELDMEGLISFTGEGANDRIALAVSSFLFGRAQDNYVSIHYLEAGEDKKQLVRASLGGLLNGVEHPLVVRTHRSYIVNLYHVNAVKGGKKDLSLYLGPQAVPIPVSKTYRDDVMEKLRQLKILT